MFLDLNYVKSVDIRERAASGGRRGSTNINISCLRGDQRPHVQAVAVAECCCSNSTLETASAEPVGHSGSSGISFQQKSKINSCASEALVLLLGGCDLIGFKFRFSCLSVSH